MPRHLVIQSDNTVAQCKNSVASMFLAWLVCRGKFLSCTMNFLIEGHTHEDVDRFFSLILSVVLRRCSWETPEDLEQHLLEKLKGHVEKKKEEFGVTYVQNIHDFDEWLGSLGITLKGCFVGRQGRLAAHSFVYKVRSDLSHAQAGAVVKRKGAKQQEDPGDVFALTKGRMHMSKWKAPVLCLPVNALSKMTGNAPPELARNDVKGPENLRKLAKALVEKMPQPKARAAGKIQSMLDENDGNPAAPLQWLADPPPPRAAVSATTNAYFDHLPDTSWELLSTFHRGPNKAPRSGAGEGGPDADHIARGEF